MFLLASVDNFIINKDMINILSQCTKLLKRHLILPRDGVEKYVAKRSMTHDHVHKQKHMGQFDVSKSLLKISRKSNV